MKATQISLQDTISNLINQIKTNESISDKNTVKLWRNDKNLTIQGIIKYLKGKLKYHNSNFKCDGLGKLIENNDIIINDLELANGDYFIAEVSDEYGGCFFKSDD